MADIRSWPDFQRGRWNWTSCGYEAVFPRGIGFTDVDAIVEINGCFLVLEAKHWDGRGDLPVLGSAQRGLFLEMARDPRWWVLALYGDAPNNLPYACRRYMYAPNGRLATPLLFDCREDPEQGRAELRSFFHQFAQWAEGQATA